MVSVHVMTGIQAVPDAPSPTPAPRARLERFAPAGPVFSAASVQFGAAMGATVIPLIGAHGVVAARQFVAALVLLPVVRVRWRSLRRAQVGHAVALGVVLVTMNLGVYTATSRVGLGLAVTLEFLGPLAVALLSSRRLVDLACGLVAAGGVVLLAGEAARVDPLGVLAGLVAAASWACYILLGRRDTGLPVLQTTALASATASLISLPLLVLALQGLTGEQLVHVALIALLTGVFSSALPYSIDFAVLRRIDRGLFAVLQSVHPAMAATFGFLVLGQSLALPQLMGLVLVCAANVVAVLQAGRRARRAPGDVPPV